VYASSKDQYGNSSVSRSGFIHYFKNGEILVKEWNKEHEELQNRTKGDLEEEKRKIRENLQNLDR